MRLAVESLAYGALGQDEASDQAFEAIRERFGGRAAVPVAGNYAQRGDLDKAFEWLERAYEQRDANLLWTLTHPTNDPLRDDPRFSELLETLKLAPRHR